MGKCNRLDKCGYHYTPHQYYDDHPWLRDTNNSLPQVCSFVQKHRENEQGNGNKPSPDYIPEWVVTYSRSHSLEADHLRWLRTLFPAADVERIASDYGIGATKDGRTIFWQRDSEGRVRTGKIMAYDTATGHRLKSEGAIGWVHSELRRTGRLPPNFNMVQCLYGEHLLAKRPEAVVAIVEAYKTAHVGAILMPDYVWVAVDSLSGLTAERLQRLKGRRVVLYPDKGRGYELWSQKIAEIATSVGFDYRISQSLEHLTTQEEGADIADVLEISNEELVMSNE